MTYFTKTRLRTFDYEPLCMFQLLACNTSAVVLVMHRQSISIAIWRMPHYWHRSRIPEFDSSSNHGTSCWYISAIQGRPQLRLGQLAALLRHVEELQNPAVASQASHGRRVQRSLANEPRRSPRRAKADWQGSIVQLAGLWWVTG